MQKRWYSIKEAAERLGVSHDTVSRLVERGERPPLGFPFGESGGGSIEPATTHPDGPRSRRTDAGRLVRSYAGPTWRTP
jgi:hypothetical protein